MIRNNSLILCLLCCIAVRDASAQGEDVYAERRAALMRTLGGGAVVIASGSSPQRMSKNFTYLTGLPDTGAVLILSPRNPIREALCTPRGKWTYALTCSSARVHIPSELGRRFVEYTAGEDSLWIAFGEFDILTKISRPVSRFSTLKNVTPILAEMRAVKDAQEIACLRKACSVAAEALNDAFRAARPGLREKDLDVIIRYGMARRYSPGETFLQAASGPNATNIHFGATERLLKEGDVIVFDVGAAWNGYTSDISRTIPASGRFSREQRHIYDLVLRAQEAGIRLLMPGQPMRRAQQVAEDTLIEGLYRLGLVLDRRSPWQRAFYLQHGFGHFIGLDVHDVWYDYRRDSSSVFRPGMVMTFEPGLYFPPAMVDSLPDRLKGLVDESEFRSYVDQVGPVYRRYADIGVRIEDDILITREGQEILSSGVPKAISDIEDLMREGSPHNAFDGLPAKER